MPNGLLGEDVVDEVCRGLHHPPSTAGRAETAAFAGKRHQVLMSASVALDAQEPVLKAAALQVVVEFLLDELWQRPTFGFQPREELGVVRLDD